MDYYIYVLKNFANFKGRARRAEYWWFVLINILVGLGISVLDILITASFGLVLHLSTIYYLAILLPGAAVTVRRLHDLNASGWWFVGLVLFSMVTWVLAMGALFGLAFAPAGFAFEWFLGLFVVGQVLGLIFVFFMCRRGTRGENRFGPDPLAEDDQRKIES
jgi:uncharacterized membrane protein YhaH (DUF805 family)